MKDLQELFESMGTDEFQKLAVLIDKKNINPQNLKKIIDYIGKVYCAEKGINNAEISHEEMVMLVESFTMSIALYQNILNGHVEIKSGRITLTDGSSCSFTLTREGIEHVEATINQ